MPTIKKKSDFFSFIILNFNDTLNIQSTKERY